MIKDYKIEAFSRPVADLPDVPNMSAGKLKEHFDSNSNELKAALNALIDCLAGENGGDELKIGGRSILEIVGEMCEAVEAEKAERKAADESKAEASEVYTKTETDEMVQTKVNASDVYTKAEVDSIADGKADEIFNSDGGIEIGEYSDTHMGVSIGYHAVADGGGVSIGKDSESEASGAAVGYKAYGAGGGGAVGNGATTKVGGGAVGIGANSENGGGSVGNGTVAKNGGGAVGQKAKTQGGGAAVGLNASSESGGAIGNKASEAVGGGAMGYSAKTEKGGGAIGNSAYSKFGGAVGFGTKTSDGAAVGYKAKTVDSGGNGIDAVQLGTGTNSVEKSVQAYDYTLMNADGSIPAERLVNISFPIETIEYSKINDVKKCGIYLVKGMSEEFTRHDGYRITHTQCVGLMMVSQYDAWYPDDDPERPGARNEGGIRQVVYGADGKAKQRYLYEFYKEWESWSEI